MLSTTAAALCCLVMMRMLADPLKLSAIASGEDLCTILIVIPAEREAREPGPIAPQEYLERWVPALASLGRDDRRVMPLRGAQAPRIHRTRAVAGPIK